MNKLLSFVGASLFASARPWHALAACLCIEFSSATSAQQAPPTSGCTVVELPTLGVRLLSDFDINHHGQAYDLHNGNVVPFVAKPK